MFFSLVSLICGLAFIRTTSLGGGRGGGDRIADRLASLKLGEPLQIFRVGERQRQVELCKGSFSTHEVDGEPTSPLPK